VAARRRRISLGEVAQGKALFTIDDIVPIAGPDGNGEIPAYQVYLCVAYLVSEGQLRRQGREGYAVG